MSERVTSKIVRWRDSYGFFEDGTFVHINSLPDGFPPTLGEAFTFLRTMTPKGTRASDVQRVTDAR